MAMKWVSRGGHLRLVKYFVTKGADEWNASLAAAARAGHQEMVECFVVKGADNWNVVMAHAARGVFHLQGNQQLECGNGRSSLQ